ncbi:MAG: bifunctional phosphopantothenoylcysteine decarboxylase/phosphopantothenate--cysteine ligase CoaBC [Nanoarchaeota archaeon]|nr:bifunctional phosphopantothenoylcysteine decarboxylase/phosphopantothenate--cysteine ligase CoaBC [Nanoarchaeota archaeon]
MKKIVLGVCSSIACYKILDLIGSLKSRYDLEVIATEGTLKLVEQEEFEKVLGKEIHINVFEKGWDASKYRSEKWMRHIELADSADLFVIAPATANVIAKLSNGFADDLLSTSVLATKAPVLVCPAMNVNMWEHPIVQANVGRLKDSGYLIVEPDEGMLACGWEGKGRLADLMFIEKEIDSVFSSMDRLNGKNVLVTAGATIEEIDPIRYLTNKSSGKMGIAIAEVARGMGAEVTLIRGKTEVDAHGVKDIEISSVSELSDAITEHISEMDIVIHAAAVSDFFVKGKSEVKIKSGSDLALELSPTTKILEKLRDLNSSMVLVGFKAEHDVMDEVLKERATDLLRSARADFIVANDVGKKVVFGSDDISVMVVGKDGATVDFSGSKREVAKLLLNHLL